MITGVETGADNTKIVNVNLQMVGMKGEEIHDDTVWIVKTHSPWLMPFAPVFHCNKIICIIRSPVDVMLSFLNLYSMGDHSSKAPFEFHEKYPKWWDWYVRHITTRMAKWYLGLMRDAKMKKLPYLFVRFEDLVNDPEP